VATRRTSPNILARKNIDFVSHSLRRYNPKSPKDVHAMQRDGVRQVDQRGRPVFTSKKDLREFLARSKGENEKYYHEYD
jgi:hypothetical protein